MAYVIGLTGGVGSGKSTVATLFAERGADLVDSDEIAHRLTAPGGEAIAAIRSVFGDTYITPEGALDRTAMRNHIFANSEARRELESILHPAIRRLCGQACLDARGYYVILMVPLLIESGDWYQRCQRVLVVDCSETTQLTRLMARSQFSEAQARSIMAAQTTREARLEVADDVIDNNGPLDRLPYQVARLHAFYRRLAAPG